MDGLHEYKFLGDMSIPKLVVEQREINYIKVEYVKRIATSDRELDY